MINTIYLGNIALQVILFCCENACEIYLTQMSGM